MSWLLFELLWRDFFRFITKKYATVRAGGQQQQQQRAAGAVPALA
jgi:deoxyribodipyrimidine photolyase